jgi:alkylhydroperoxidase family enzyme
MALAAGVSQAKVDAVGFWPSSDEFDEPERAALALTDAICDVDVSEGIWIEAARWFEAGALVELVVTAATYVMVPRVLHALAVPMEAAATGGDLGSPGEP